MRDGDKDHLAGKGCLKAVDHVNNEIAKAVIGLDVTEQRLIDQTMIDLDGTPNKGKLGANAILGVSWLLLDAADEVGLPLYQYLGGPNAHVFANANDERVLNGGAHSTNTVDFEEFMIMPVGAKSVREAVRMGSETFHALQALLKSKGDITAVGDEGGFAPNLKDNEEAFKLLVEAIKKAGYKPGDDIALAASTLLLQEMYDADTRRTQPKWSNPDKKYTTEEWTNMIDAINSIRSFC